MGNRLTTLSTLVILVATLQSCEKESTRIPGSSGVIDELESFKIGGQDWTLVRDEAGPRCPMPATNCVQISLLAPDDDCGVGAVLSAIKCGEQVNIVSAFETNKEELNRVMYSNDINDVINEELIATSDTSADGEVYFIILTDLNESEVVTAYRFDYDE